MRTFYLFNITDNFYNLFKKDEEEIYKIILQISKISKEDIVFGNNIFNQICSPINNRFLDKRIFIDNHTLLSYSKNADTHIYNDLHMNEVTYMTIKSSYILIKSNKDIPTFFKILDIYNYHLFVCDFENKDYFFLKKFKVKI